MDSELLEGTPHSGPTHGAHRGLLVGRHLPRGQRLCWALLWAHWPPAAGPVVTPCVSPPVMEGRWGGEPSHREKVAPDCRPQQVKGQVCSPWGSSHWGPAARDLHASLRDGATLPQPSPCTLCPSVSASPAGRLPRQRCLFLPRSLSSTAALAPSRAWGPTSQVGACCAYVRGCCMVFFSLSADALA